MYELKITISVCDRLVLNISYNYTREHGYSSLRTL